MKTELIALDSLKATNLPELQGLKDKQIELVKECPFVEIVDNQSYELAKKHRTALVKGRTSLESQDKLIASKLTAFRKEVKSVTDDLISITLPHEEKQQEEVKRFEQIKENERLEKERIENERIEKIKSKISELETMAYEEISKLTFSDLEKDNSSFVDLVTDFDFEEFDILYTQAKERVYNVFESKSKQLQEKENQRIENERLAREKAEADAKLQAIELQQEKERAEREEKERIEKEKVFEVRVKRLNKIGIVLNGLNYFVCPLGIRGLKEYSKSQVLNFDAIEFEEYLESLKKTIQDAADELAQQELNRLAQEKSDAELKAKSEKENKARVKRLAKDKAIYKKTLNDTLGRFPLFFDSNEIEVKEFSIYASNRVTDLLKELLTELENL